MEEREVTQKQVEQLIGDASYLQKEAEALKYVIEDVPYGAEPSDGRSIAEILSLMDHAQYSYYHPIINEIINNKRPVHLNDFEDYKDTFSFQKEKNNIQRILDTLANHRASLVNDLNDISIITWNRASYGDDREILLADIVRQMNRDDQIHLKKITNLIKAYYQEKNTQREIKQRRKRQEIEYKEE